MPLHKIHDRYLNDPLFASVVHALEMLILKLEMTPSEVRECAVYACMRTEMHKPIEIRLSQDEIVEFLRGREAPRK